LGEERRGGVRGGGGPAAVEEDEERPASPAAARDDEHFVQVATDQTTAQGEPLHAEAPRRPVAAADLADRDDAGDGDHGADGEQDEAPPHDREARGSAFSRGLPTLESVAWGRP